MLDPKDRLVHFDKAHPETHTWVVSDLKTKSTLQSRMLSRFQMIEDDSILRVSELWRLLFFRHYPSWRVISGDLTKALFQTWSEDSDFEWARSPGANAEIFHLVQFLAPVFESQIPEENLVEWFRQNPMSYLNWGEWYLVARDYWSRLKEKRWIPGACMGAALLSVEAEELKWNRPLSFDVGAELVPFEVELIKKLSLKVETSVLQPDFQDESIAYSYGLFGFSPVKKASREMGVSNQQVRLHQVKRFATSLSETKDCVHQVRKWIEEEQIPPDKIVIVAPDPKPFERVLEFYMDVEGIPFTCDATSALTDLPTFCDWLASLSISFNPQKESIEQIVFRSSKKPFIDVETFRSLYTNIYSDVDLTRNEVVFQNIKNLLSTPTERVSRDEFLLSAIRLIPEEAPLEKFESFLKNFLMDIPTDLELPLSSWVSYLKARALKSEARISRSDAGVRLIKVDSFDDVDVDRAYLLDLTERSLKSQRIERIEPSDIRRLSSDLGWPVHVEDPLINEWKIKWSMQGLPAVVLAVSSTDWFGDTQSPSLLWLDNAIQSGRAVEEINKPRPTVWDARQRQTREQSFRNYDSDFFEKQKYRLDVDRGVVDLSAFTFNPVHLSASGVEDYRRCPFVYAAKRVFGLSDYVEIDLDIDPMTRGSLLHRAFELLLEDGVLKEKHTVAELETLLDTCAQDVKMKTKDSVFWPSQRAVYIRLLQKFLDFESLWRKHRPETKTVGRELAVDGYFNPKNKTFEKEFADGYVPFKGRIDRADQGTKGEVFLLDYKSSSTGIVKLQKTVKLQKSKSSSSWSWLEKNKLQLILYALAVEAGLSDLGPTDVLGVAYFDFKKMERKLGFKCTEQETSLFLADDDEITDLTLEQKHEIFSQVAEIYKDVLLSIRAGQFAPKPLKPEECSKCEWRTLCRASHLN